MFTGIIEVVGTIGAVRERAGAREFMVRAPEIVSEIKPGDSITLDGACQTAVKVCRDNQPRVFLAGVGAGAGGCGIVVGGVSAATR